MLLNDSISLLPNTSSITKNKLLKFGINTYWDLLNYFPFRYNNFSIISTINRVQNGEVLTIKGKIIEGKFQLTKRGTRLIKFAITDGTGNLDLVWFNQPYLLKLLKPGSHISVSGTISFIGNKPQIDSPEYEFIKYGSDTIHTGRIVPVYSEKIKISTKTLREKIYKIALALNDNKKYTSEVYLLEDFLPTEIIKFNNLIDEASAYISIHFPQNFEVAKQAKERLAFDELFTIQLSAQLIKNQWQKEITLNPFIIGKKNQKLIDEFIKNLPFILTAAQQKVVSEIQQDLVRKIPMNRFLQGDVGSGKTVVAAIACYISYLNGYQSLIMAPTEILAIQHFETLKKLFKKYKINIALQTGSVKNITTLQRPHQSGHDFDIAVGTHALIQKKLKFNKIGLVVIDEQHRFGVSQRAQLKEKGISPHLLTMTATPIPRTIVLTVFGELDMSIIDEMPKGRMPIKTFLVPTTKRNDGYQWIKKQITEKRVQAFVICPLIEESQTETLQSVRAATIEYQNLKENIFPDLKIAMLHGKLKPREKEKIMKDFKCKKYDILVATSVVEVGIDIPNATIMLIEGAERFGMAQLHQLRGRVGRGNIQSYCFLFTEKDDEEIIKRLQFFSLNHSGIVLAEYDLKIRGPGSIFGTKQHGYVDLKIASLMDLNLIRKTKNAVYWFVNHYADLNKFPEIDKRVKEFQKKIISRD